MTDKRARETCSGRQKSRKTGETGTVFYLCCRNSKIMILGLKVNPKWGGKNDLLLLHFFCLGPALSGPCPAYVDR